MNLIYLFLLFFSRSPAASTAAGARLDTLFDAARNRRIPIAVYTTAAGRQNGIPIIFSHGYGMNRPDSYTHYTYLTHFLSANGYYVVSIQHELPTDSLIPSSGIPQVVRKPFWERGAANIQFVFQWLKKTQPQLKYDKLVLAGHSNGADMSALYPQLYPGEVYQLITLDNRRMALPRSGITAVLSLRSSDQSADAGVLPPADSCRLLHTQLVQLHDTRHNDMDDSGNAAQHGNINREILQFLQKNP